MTLIETLRCRAYGAEDIDLCDELHKAADRLEAAEKLVEELCDCLENHAGNYKLTKAECVPINEALAAAKQFKSN